MENSWLFYSFLLVSDRSLDLLLCKNSDLKINAELSNFGEWKMRIPRSLSLFFITTLYLIAPVNGICGLILTQGESYSIEFDSLSYCTEFTDERYISGLVTLTSNFGILLSQEFVFRTNAIKQMIIWSAIAEI